MKYEYKVFPVAEGKGLTVEEFNHVGRLGFRYLAEMRGWSDGKPTSLLVFEKISSQTFWGRVFGGSHATN